MSLSLGIITITIVYLGLNILYSYTNYLDFCINNCILKSADATKMFNRMNVDTDRERLKADSLLCHHVVGGTATVVYVQQ